MTYVTLHMSVFVFSVGSIAQPEINKKAKQMDKYQTKWIPTISQDSIIESSSFCSNFCLK